jgi:hypothetical protein
LPQQSHIYTFYLCPMQRVGHQHSATTEQSSCCFLPISSPFDHTKHRQGNIKAKIDPDWSTI